MRRVLLPLLVIVLVLAIAGPAVAKNDDPGPPAMATGRCSTEQLVAPDDVWHRNFAFHASGTFDSAKGMVLYRRVGDAPWGGDWLWAKFEVRHLIVDDNRAILAGLMIKSDNDATPRWMFFLVEDNGDSAGAAPDRIRPVHPTDMYTPPTYGELNALLLDEAEWEDARDIRSGNIQIH